MQALVTPVTPAAVLGHVDPRPSPCPIRKTGFSPMTLLDVIRQSFAPRSEASQGWENLPIGGLLYGGSLRDAQRQRYEEFFGGLELGPQPEYEFLARIEAVGRAYTATLLPELRDVYARFEEALYRILEASGVSVSTHNHNADVGGIVVYVGGKPVGSTHG